MLLLSLISLRTVQIGQSFFDRIFLMCYNNSKTMDNIYINLLDEFDNEEKAVFLYCFVLKLPLLEASKRLNISIHRISKIYRMIKQQKELMFIKNPSLLSSLICSIWRSCITLVSKVVVFPTCFIFVPRGTSTPSTSKTIILIFPRSFFEI